MFRDLKSGCQRRELVPRKKRRLKLANQEMFLCWTPTMVLRVHSYGSPHNGGSKSWGPKWKTQICNKLDPHLKPSTFSPRSPLSQRPAPSSNRSKQASLSWAHREVSAGARNWNVISKLYTWATEHTFPSPGSPLATVPLLPRLRWPGRRQPLRLNSWLEQISRFGAGVD
jgi:hypothetical protein